MNYDFLNLAPTPCDEPCAQVGTDNYHEQSRIELRVFKAQLYRMLDAEFGPDSLQVSVGRVAHSHDFGSYHDLEVKYNPLNPESVKQAFWLEENLPENWDKEALSELKEAGYTLNKV